MKIKIFLSLNVSQTVICLRLQEGNLKFNRALTEKLPRSCRRLRNLKHSNSKCCERQRYHKYKPVPNELQYIAIKTTKNSYIIFSYTKNPKALFISLKLQGSCGSQIHSCPEEKLTKSYVWLLFGRSGQLITSPTAG